jgi:hypothetical protein
VGPGGSEEHSHAVTVDFGEGIAAMLTGDLIDDDTGAQPTHGHAQVLVQSASASSIPPYIDVVYIKRMTDETNKVPCSDETAPN